MADKYLGFVSIKIPSNDESKGANAILKVVAIKENENYRKLSPEEAKQYCSPDGLVFGPQLFKADNSDFCEGTFIEFETSHNKETEKKVINQTDFIVNYSPRPKAINLPRLVSYNGKINKIISRGYLSPDEVNTTIDKKNVFDEKNTKFFLYDSVEQKAIGIFRYQSSSDTIESNHGKDVQELSVHSSNVITGKEGKNYLLFNEKQNNLDWGSIIDFMTNQQLADWLKTKFNDISSVDKKTLSLICGYPESQSVEDDRDASRFERLKEKQEAFEINVQSLVDLVCTHPNYFSQFISNIDLIEKEVKESFEKKFLLEASDLIKENQERIKEQENELLKLDDTLKREKDKISVDIEKTKEILSKKKEELSKQVYEKSAQLKVLNDNYDAVIATINAIAPALNSFSKGSTGDEEVEIFKVDFPKGENARSYSQIKVEDDESFISFMKRHVCCDDEKLTTYLKQVKNVFSYKACFIPNTALAYLYAKAIRNTEVMIMHVEHDWLHYSDFVKHGLLEAFKKANDDSEKNYILVFDGLNITQPECGLRPLLNLINGDVPILEQCGFAFPNNMTIMATLLPSTGENAIGLKLNSSFYNKWFSIGDPAEDSDKIFLPSNFRDEEVADNCGYVKPSELPKAQITEKTDGVDKYLNY